MRRAKAVGQRKEWRGSMTPEERVKALFDGNVVEVNKGDRMAEVWESDVVAAIKAAVAEAMEAGA